MPLNNFGVVGPSIYRSAQPDMHGLMRAATGLGVTTVLKLNTDEEGLEPMLPGVVVWKWPLGLTAPPDADTRQQARLIAVAVAHGQTVLVHCTHGRDRGGFFAAAYQILELGWSLEMVLKEREAHGVDNFISRLTNHSFTEALERFAKGT